MTDVLIFLSVLALEAVFVVLMLGTFAVIATGVCMGVDWLIDRWQVAAFRRAVRRGDVVRVLGLGDELLGRHR